MTKILFAAVVLMSTFAQGAPARLITRCGHVAQSKNQSVQWDYCISKTENSRNDDLVYLLHGAGGDEKTWTQWPAFQGVRDRWEKNGTQAPIIVTVSFGPIWLLIDRNSSPQSGLIDIFVKEVMPHVEQKLLAGTAIKNRHLLGLSMGGYNGSQLALKAPRAFKDAVLACPGILTVSPYAPQQEIDAYISRTGADKDFVSAILKISKNYFPDPSSWKSNEPLRLARMRFGSTSPSLYISCGRTDEGGFFEGAESLAKIAEANDVKVKWEALAGGHCVMNSDAIADFLTGN